MKLYKKSQSVGRHIIVMILIILAVVIVMSIIIWQSKDVMYAYLNKIF
jgi:hypothetical protein